MNMNLKKASIVAIAVGVLGFVLAALISAAGIASFLTGIFGQNIVAASAPLFGTVLVFGFVGLLVDYAFGYLHMR